jgi:hypothetical protein
VSQTLVGEKLQDDLLQPYQCWRREHADRTNHILRSNLCSKCTSFTAGNRTILTLSAKEGMKFARASQFGDMVEGLAAQRYRDFVGNCSSGVQHVLSKIYNLQL